MKKLPIIFLLFLAACGHVQQVAEPVTVKVPVPVSCNIENIREPDWNVPRIAANAKPYDKLKAALADLELSKGYIEELTAELEACS